MKRASSCISEATRCYPVANKRWTDFDENEFQPYQHLDRHLPDGPIKYFKADTPYASLVSFKSSGGNAVYTCELCQVDVTAKHAFESAKGPLMDHCRTKEHHKRAKLTFAMRSSGLTKWCSALQCRMDKLPPAPWQKKVQRKMLTALLNEFDEADLASEQREVETYELKEQLFVLELATWKYICIANSGIKRRARNFRSLLDWSHDGWKADKSAMRDDNGIGIIIQSVLPFLAPKPAKRVVKKRSRQVFCPSDHVHRIFTVKWTLVDELQLLSIVRRLDSGMYRCEVCNQSFDCERNVRLHCRIGDHNLKSHRIMRLQRCPMKVWCAHVKNQVEQYPESASWTHDVKSMLFWLYIGYQAWSQEKTDSRKKQIEDLVYQHEVNERMILLQLVATKFLCVMNPPAKGDKKDMKNCSWERWIRRGWKRQKAVIVVRDSLDIALIVNCVRPFVGPDSGPPPIVSTDEMSYASSAKESVSVRAQSDDVTISSSDDEESTSGDDDNYHGRWENDFDDFDEEDDDDDDDDDHGW